jgi:predicted nucleic acid-binding protein
MAQVIDASIAIAWCVPSQSTPASVSALKSTFADGGYVPAQFWFEVLHGLARSERRGAVLRAEVDEFVGLLSKLSLKIDTAYDNAAMVRLHVMARHHALSIYDASYLELALRVGLPLATRDAALARAARAAGVALFSV